MSINSPLLGTPGGKDVSMVWAHKAPIALYELLLILSLVMLDLFQNIEYGVIMPSLYLYLGA